MDTATTLAPGETEPPAHRSTTAALTLAALGVVYGDIGTSPLYTIKEIFAPGTGVPLNPATIIGAVSVVFWLLMLVVTLKYVTLIMRASNRGEGGIMALLALASSTATTQPKLRNRLLLMGAFGAALFYGDSVLTPAISVLSAVEGLEVATPAFKAWVLPLSIAILVVLFVAQSRGTGTMGRWFGPVIIVWFLTLAGVGAWQISQAPQILQAIDPRHAYAFLRDRGWGLFIAMGAVVLAVTGAEALYADMGHFGKRAIRIAWTSLVLPALAINYAGQGALLLREGATAAANPFYLSFPTPLLLPAVVVSTLATIIASQAVISGAYSLTQQAIQLGFLPRMQIVHTSAQERGQVYVPAVNWILLTAVVLACVGFGNSSAMASAYGIAVTGTMLITTVLTYFVVRRAWGFPWWMAAGATAFFVVLDAILFVSCSIKVLEGGWFPLALATGMLVVMTAWKRGRELLSQTLQADQLPLAAFVEGLASDTQLVRVDRTAVFMSSEPGVVPQALLHNMKHNLVLHQRNLVLTVRYEEQPVVPPTQRVRIEAIGHGFWQVTARFGFTERPDVPAALALCAAQGLQVDPFSTSFFLSRETVVPRPKAAMARWRQNLFEALSRNAGRAVDYFGIPYNGVIELGTRVQL